MPRMIPAALAALALALLAASSAALAKPAAKAQPRRTLADVQAFFAARAGSTGADPRFFGVNAQSAITATSGEGCLLSLTTASDRYDLDFANVSSTEPTWSITGGLVLRGGVRTASGRMWPQLNFQFESDEMAQRARAALDFARRACARRGGF